MPNRILQKAWMLAVCLPSLALAQQPAERGDGTWELSAGGGIKIMNSGLRDFLASGSASDRFTSSATPGRIMPSVAVRLGHNFSRHFGFSLGAEGATGSGVKYLSPFAAITYTANLNARTSPFITAGTQFTRITGQNGRITHPTWGAHLGIGLRSMVSQKLALRLEGRMATEHYAELPGEKAAYPLFATIGISYFLGGRGPGPRATAPAPCSVCTVARTRVDTIVQTRVDTVSRLVHDGSDQLVLRVQFRTGRADLLPQSLPVLDTIARAIVATPNSSWEVVGHTDSTGSAKLNTRLAQARAETVMNYLISRGVNRTTLTASGFGRERPVFSNTSAYGRAQNRRVQLRRIPPPPSGEPVR
jgi:outer membrane protein OmpA-like peptidoglycan-associated protein